MYFLSFFSEAKNVCKGEEKVVKACHQCTSYDLVGVLTLLHLEWPKLQRVLAFLSAIGLSIICQNI